MDIKQEESKMVRARLVASLLVIAMLCAMAATSFAVTKPKPACGFTGFYSFFFWDPDEELSGVGYFEVNCAGAVLPGGIINCNEDDTEYESFIEGGAVFLETDGEGTMLLETESSDGICDTGTNALELDISVVLGGKTVLFNSNGEPYAANGTTPQAGHTYTITGRADKCFAGQISGCYDIRFWSPDDTYVGDCTICVNRAGGVTGGTCSCNADGTEYLSEIETGGYTLGEKCESSTGYLWFTTSSDEICDEESSLALDFAVANGGNEIIGTCDPGDYILDNTSLDNAGTDLDSCVFEGWSQVVVVAPTPTPTP